MFILSSEKMHESYNDCSGETRYLISPGNKLQMLLGSRTDVLTVGALELI